MPAKYVGFVIFIYVCAIIFGSISTGTDLFANPNITDPVQATQVYGIQEYQTDFITVTNPSFSLGFFTSFFHILTLDFPIFNSGPWIVLRWLILAPIIGIVVFGMIQLFTGIMQRNI